MYVTDHVENPCLHSGVPFNFDSITIEMNINHSVQDASGTDYDGRPQGQETDAAEVRNHPKYILPSQSRRVKLNILLPNQLRRIKLIILIS